MVSGSWYEEAVAWCRENGILNKENTQLYHFELTEDEMAQINALDRGEKHDWY